MDALPAVVVMATAALAAATSPKDTGQRCRPGECESCPFPPCNEREREKNIKED